MSRRRARAHQLRLSGQPEADGLLFLCPLVLLLRVWEGVTAAPVVWQIISICLVLLCLGDVRRSPYILCTFRLSKSRCFFHENLMMKDDTEGFFFSSFNQLFHLLRNPHANGHNNGRNFPCSGSGGQMWLLDYFFIFYLGRISFFSYFFTALSTRIAMP